MITLLEIDLSQIPCGELNRSSFVAITGTDFPALSVVTWDYNVTPPLSSVVILPRYARLVYSTNSSSVSSGNINYTADSTFITSDNTFITADT